MIPNFRIGRCFHEERACVVGKHMSVAKRSVQGLGVVDWFMNRSMGEDVVVVKGCGSVGVFVRIECYGEIGRAHV